MDLISVIVPVYNEEERLKDSIGTLLNQTYNNLEIILINDGSADRSGEICDEIAKKDGRIKVFHQENRGLCAARNVGLNNATGDYITFMDSDDLVKQDIYEFLLNNLKENNADISMCASEIHHLNGKIEYIYGTGKKYIFDRREAIKELLKGGLFATSCCTKLFKAEIAQKIRFVEERTVNEDKYYTYQAFCLSDRIVFEDVSKYIYLKQENSISTLGFRKATFDQTYFSKEILKDIKEKYPELSSLAEYNHFKTGMDVLRQYYRHKDAIITYKKEAEELKKEVFSYYGDSIKGNISYMKRAEFFLLKNCLLAYRALLPVYDKLIK